MTDSELKNIISKLREFIQKERNSKTENKLDFFL